MSQDIRRRLAARKRLAPPPRSEADVPAPLRFRRFSQGIDHAGLEQVHVGRFSEGVERLPEDHPSKAHVGRYSDGLDHRSDDADSSLRVGRFSRGIDHTDL